MEKEPINNVNASGFPPSGGRGAIELRSEDFQEILGQTPAWLVRSGTAVIACVVVLALLLSFVFKYPDIIESRVVITTENPPSSLNALSTGKITDLFFAEKQPIKKGQTIAIIENTANYKDIIFISNLLDSITNINNISDTLKLNLGECQPYYSLFIKQIKAQQTFKELGAFAQKTKTAKQEIADLQAYSNRLSAQKELSGKELKITQEQLDRDKDLMQKNIIPKSEYERTERAFLQQNLALEGIKTQMANTQMQINKLEQQILDLSIQEQETEIALQTAINESFENLKSQLNSWKQRYLLVSPINGTVTFTKFWSRNQNVQNGETVATIIPDQSAAIIGKVEIPATGAGKVKVGQTVNIKLDNFPYMEYGMMRGTVKSISLVPVSNQGATVHTAEIAIANDFVSNYGKNIQFTQEMTGTAEIITEDLRLIQRLLYPLKSIWKKNI